jgi:RNA polymerase sigma factor (sigma-70 family)
MGKDKLTHWHIHAPNEQDASQWLYENMLHKPDEPLEERDEQRDADKQELANTFLDMLSPEQREAVELVTMQGISHKSAANMLGITMEALRKRLSRAYQRMREVASRTQQDLY